MLVAPCVLLPFNSVNGEQFRCYKSPKGEEGRERLTGSTVADGDLQSLASVFYAAGPPSLKATADPNLRFFVGAAPFPLFLGFEPHFPHILPFFWLLLLFLCVN